MPDFLDELVDTDETVDAELGDDGVLVHNTIAYNLRGPFDREAYTDETGDARSIVLRSTYSVRSSEVPANPRNGVLTVRGERFLVVDYENPLDGRTLLILDKHNAPP